MVAVVVRNEIPPCQSPPPTHTRPGSVVAVYLSYLLPPSWSVCDADHAVHRVSGLPSPSLWQQSLAAYGLLITAHCSVVRMQIGLHAGPTHIVLVSNPPTMCTPAPQCAYTCLFAGLPPPAVVSVELAAWNPSLCGVVGGEML